MTVQDLVAIMCVAAAAVFLFSRTIARPLLSRNGSRACGRGCGNCSAGNVDTTAIDPDERLVTIGPPVSSAPKKSVRSDHG